MKNKRLIIILLSALSMLLIPLMAMQFTNEVNWALGDFIIAGILLLGTGLLFELIIRKMKEPKYLIVIFSLLITQTINAQVISKKDMVNTEWFTENIDSLFFKSDTVKLIKYSYKVTDDLGFNQYAESEHEYFGHGYLVKIEFGKFGHFDYWAYEYHKGTITKNVIRTWKYNKSENYLSIYKNKNIESSFIPVSIKEIEVPSGHSGTPDRLKTLELTMIRIK